MSRQLHQHLHLSICGFTLVAVGMVASIPVSGMPAALGSASNTTPPPQFVVVPSPLFEDDRTLFMYVHEYLPYATGERVQVFRSTNGGDTWWPIFRLSDHYRVQGEVIVGRPYPDHVSPVVYLNLSHSLDPTVWELLRSLNGGATWVELTSPSWSGYCSSPVLTDDSNTLFSHCAILEPYSLFKGIQRSQDGGMSWKLVWSNAGVYDMTLSPTYSQDHTVFASTQRLSASLAIPKLITSSDGGATWESRDAGLCNMTVGSITVSPNFQNDQTLYVSQRRLIFRSEDTGASWRHVYAEDDQACEDSYDFYRDSLEISPDYPLDRAIFWNRPDLLSLYASYDDGQSWQILTRGGYDLHVRRNPSLRLPDSDSAISQDRLFGSEPDPTDLADASRHAFLTFLPQVVARGPQSLPLTLFISRGTSPPSRSDDGGVTWHAMKLPPYRTTFLPLLVANP